MIGVELFVEIKYLDRQGLNKTQIADRLGIDRKTVRKYVNQDVKSFEQESSKQRSILNPYKPYLQYRLSKFPELTAARLCREISTLSCAGDDHNDLLPRVPYEGSERTVVRYIQSIRPHDERTYRPVETLPGEQAQADWGHFGYINMDGKRKHLYAFSFVLSYSRVRYVQFTTRQDTLTLLCCLQNAFEYIDGVPQIILFDNAKTVVSERVGSVIQFNRDLMRLVLQYGFKAGVCWIYDPESKGKVKNSIKYVNKDFLYSHPVTDLETLNNEYLGWCDEVAREVPADRLGEEKQALLPVPSNGCAVFSQVTRNVSKNCMFSFETNEYPVPREYTRKKVTVNVYPERLEVYAGNKRIAVHERCFERGQIVIEDGHFDDRPYEERRRKDALQTKFESLGPVAPKYLKGLARSRQGNLREQALQILKLAEEYGKETVHAAMSHADSFDCYSFSAVQRIIQTQLVNPYALPDEPLKSHESDYFGPTIEVEKRTIDDYIRLLEVAPGGN